MTAFTLPRLGAIAAACALLLPGLAQSRPVTITTQLKNYNGDGAYLAVYLTNAQGAYAGTLWVAGSKAKYYKHLSAWSRLSAADNQRLLGVTGASVGAGRTLKVTADLADALLDAGYETRIDAAVEDQRDSPAEVRLPLSTAQAGQPVRGKQYIQSTRFDLP